MFFKNSLVSFPFFSFTVFPHIFESSMFIGVSESIFALIFHDSSGINARISRSRSTRSFTATDWTRPAESPDRTFFQSTGETSYHTIRSRILRDCCAFTRSRCIFRGVSIACSIAVFVISWNTIRSTFVGSSPRAIQRCHPIASHSRSSSVAIHIFSCIFCEFFEFSDSFLLLRWYFILRDKSAHYINSHIFSGRSRICPKDASTLYSFPRNFSIVFPFAGDSTITRFFAIFI